MNLPPYLILLLLILCLSAAPTAEAVEAQTAPIPMQHATHTKSAPQPKDSDSSINEMDDWGVWNSDAMNGDADPLLSLEANEAAAMHALDDPDNPENSSYPLGVGGEDELRMNALDDSVIGDIDDTFAPPDQPERDDGP